jgi:U3 small nucleolar RNA-associated protein 13
MVAEEQEDASTGSFSENEQQEEDSSKANLSSSLSKSWAITAAHVPTYTGGKVTHCHKTDKDISGRPFILLPVHGDLAIVDAGRGVKLGTLRGEDTLGDTDDEEEGLDLDAISSHALDNKDQTIITCTRNNILHQYSISEDDRSTKLVKTWGRSGHSLPVIKMEFHISNVFLATGSVDGTVRIWDIRGGFVTHVFRPLEGGDGGGSGRLSVTALKWRGELGQLTLAIGRDDGSMTIHDLRDNNDILVLRDHVSSVTSMDWWGEEFFVSSGRDAILNLWRIVPVAKSKNTDKKSIKNKFSYRRIQSIPVYEQVEGMLLIPSERTNQIKVVTAGSKGLIRLWKAIIISGQTPELVQGMEQPASQSFGEARGGYLGLFLNHLAVSGNNKEDQIIAADAEHNLSFISSKLSVNRTVVGHNDEILDMKVIPNLDSVVVATNSPQIRIFDLSTFSCKVLDGHTSTVLCIEVSPCGRFFASCGKDKTMRIWHIESLRCVALATGHTEPIGACGLSRKIGRYEVGGKAAANGGGAFCITASLDRTLKRWNFPGVDEVVNSGELADLLASSSIRGHEKDINIVSIAPNDSLVASGSQDKTVCLWNTTDLSLKATLKGHRRGVWDCQFSPIDRVLATSSGDKTIKLWSLSDFSCVRTFQGHLSSVLRIRFLRTGLQLVSSGADGLLKLWTIRTSECETTMDGHSNKVWALDTSSDGHKVVSGGADSKLIVWEDNTQQIEDDERMKEAESIRLHQMLENHLYHNEFDKALELALQVDKPMKVLKIISSIIESTMDGEEKSDGLESLQSHVKTWEMDRVEKILKYCRDWNTRARNASVAMILVKAIVTSIPVDKLSSVYGIPEILAGITPYAERHFDRLDRLYTSSYILDFTLHGMGIFDPDDLKSSEQDFTSWEASSKLVLPPTIIDGRVQVGGRDYIGKTTGVNNVKMSLDSFMKDDESVGTIGDSSTDSSSIGEDSD